MGRSEQRQGITIAGASSVFAVVAVLILVSLPRLHAFAVEENETDAAVLTRRLALALGEMQSEAAEPSLPSLVEHLGMERRTDDLEWLEDGRLLRRHGYLFRVVSDGEVQTLRAWPWAHGQTGHTAYFGRPDGTIRRHANADGHWSGPAGSPAITAKGWSAIPASDPSSW